jgi:hypothetical protein
MSTRKGVVLGVLLGFLTAGFFAAEAKAQIVENKRFEFSTAASVWNIKWEGEENQTVFNVPVRLGFFIYKGLEIEPELLLTIPEESDSTGIIAVGNLVYNFKLSGKAVPFVLGGAGYGNAYPFFCAAFDWDDSVTVLNFGAGIKLLVGDSAALRLEYRFSQYSESSGGDKRTDNNFMLGVSLFF